MSVWTLSKIVHIRPRRERIYRWVQRDEVAGIKSTHRAHIALVFLTGTTLRRLRRLKAKAPNARGFSLMWRPLVQLVRRQPLKYACLQKP
jgi:hypothetical protein